MSGTRRFTWACGSGCTPGASSSDTPAPAATSSMASSATSPTRHLASSSSTSSSARACWRPRKSSPASTTSLSGRSATSGSPASAAPSRSSRSSARSATRRWRNYRCARASSGGRGVPGRAVGRGRVHFQASSAIIRMTGRPAFISINAFRGAQASRRDRQLARHITGKLRSADSPQIVDCGDRCFRTQMVAEIINPAVGAPPFLRYIRQQLQCPGPRQRPQEGTDNEREESWSDGAGAARMIVRFLASGIVVAVAIADRVNSTGGVRCGRSAPSRRCRAKRRCRTRPVSGVRRRSNEQLCPGDVIHVGERSRAEVTIVEPAERPARPEHGAAPSRRRSAVAGQAAVRRRLLLQPASADADHQHAVRRRGGGGHRVPGQGRGGADADRRLRRPGARQQPARRTGDREWPGRRRRGRPGAHAPT